MRFFIFLFLFVATFKSSILFSKSFKSLSAQHLAASFKSQQDTTTFSRQELNFMLNSLEYRKQALFQRRISIEKQINILKKRLKNYDTSSPQHTTLQDSIYSLEDQLIKNEVDYEDVQYTLQQIMKKMQVQIQTKDSLNMAAKEKIETIEQEKITTKKEFQRKLIAYGFVLFFILNFAIVYYVVFNKIKKKNQQLRLAYAELRHTKEKIEKTYKQIKYVEEIGKKATSSLEYKNLVEILYFHLKKMMDIQSLSIGVLTEEKETLDFEGKFLYGKYIKGKKIFLHDSSQLATWCIKNCEYLIINDLLREYKKYINLSDLTASHTAHSAIYLPLLAEDEVIGVLIIQANKKNAYKNMDEKILNALASYASIALVNMKAYKKIQEHNGRMNEYFSFAKKIQRAILPLEGDIELCFEDCFVWYQPKNKVSGDMYWFARIPVEHANDKNIIIVADSTGESISGAFLSVIASMLLHEIVNVRNIHDTHQIICEFDSRFKSMLKEKLNHSESMDVCLCGFEKQDDSNTLLTFSSAKRPLLYKNRDSKKLEYLSGSLKSVGGYHKGEKKFITKRLILHAQDEIYLFSDGITNQNSPDEKKLSRNQLKNMIEENIHLDMQKQKHAIMNAFRQYRQDKPQRDDITLIGIRII